MNCPNCQHQLPNRLALFTRVDNQNAGEYKCANCSQVISSRYQIFRFRILCMITVFVMALTTRELLGRYLRVNPLETDLQLLQVSVFIIFIILLVFLIALLRVPIDKKPPSFIKSSLFFFSLVLFFTSLMIFILGSFVQSLVLMIVGATLFIGSFFWAHIFY